MLARLRHAVTLWRWRRDQDALKSRLIEVDDFAWSTYSGTACKSTEPPPSKPPLRLIGGLDISFFSDGEDPDDKRACVALIVCEFDDSLDDLNVVWKDFQFVEMTELYVPGYLAFREVEHYLTMLRRLEANRPDLRPDVILMDGNGLLHPRGFGVASHIGVLSGYCTIGVAKKLHMVDGLDRSTTRKTCAPGCYVPLQGDSGRIWGAALLPQPRKPLGSRRMPQPTNPIYISVGHRICLDSCIAVVRLCLISARIPEPIRLADLLSREQVRWAKEKGMPEKPVDVFHRRWLGSAAVAAVLGVALVALGLRRYRFRLCT